ncbi:toll/interleukin-1 receptor domain-containing protein [Micromonospora profundi]|uniref:toll/interleukin-1 receptor domain-containing protein n=1 Tax=Micromonospora profundi TaxID=1420889 RepID=UPI00381E5199
MKIFISWSGEPSRQIARALREWLSVVVQHVEPWMSDEEIQSGTRWNDSIAHSLDATNFGIVCVTRATQNAPWLLFEAGALAKGLEQARVVPLCIDLEPSDITSPLHAFQARKLDQDGMRRLVYELSELAENPRPRESIDTLFEAMWPRLEGAVAEAASVSAPSVEPRRTAEDMLAELVTRVRNIERDVEQKESESRAETAYLTDRLNQTIRALETAERAAEHAALRAEESYAARAAAEARAAQVEKRLAEARALTEKLRDDLPMPHAQRSRQRPS